MKDKLNKILKSKKFPYILGGILLVIAAVIAAIIIFGNKEKTYAITFDTDGGTVVEKVVVKEGENLPLPEEPTKEGYKFNGWLLDGQTFAPSTKITKDIKLVANWISNDAKTFKVTFNADNGLEANVIEVVENTAVAKPMDPNKDNFTFKGWFLNGAEYNFETLVSEDITLAAQWEEVKKEDSKKTESSKVVTPGTVEVTGVTLNKTSVALRKGASDTLVATVLPANATNKAVTWSSSNTGVATVSNGVVTGVASGTAVITVKTADGKSAIANVTVTNPVTGLKITYNRTYLYHGDTTLRTARPTLQYLPADADPSSKGIVVYKGSGNIGGQFGSLGLNPNTGEVTTTNTAAASTNSIWAEMGGIKSNAISIVTEAKLQYNFTDFPAAPGCKDLSLNKGASQYVSLNTGSNISLGNNYAGISVSPLSGSGITIKAGNTTTNVSSPLGVYITSYAGQKGCINVGVL